MLDGVQITNYTTPLSASKNTKKIELVRSTFAKSLIITKAMTGTDIAVSDETKRLFNNGCAAELIKIAEEVNQLKHMGYKYLKIILVKYLRKSNHLSKPILID